MHASEPGGTGRPLSRRGFLTSSAVAATGLMAAPLILKGGEDAAAPLNVALIGCGKQGLVLAAQAMKIPGIRFQAVCDIWDYSRGRSSRRFKALGHPGNPYIDYRDLLENEKTLDAAIVATPDWMHAEHTIACLEAGLAVYCEKEMSNDLAKARAMVRAARKTGHLLQIGHQRRSNPRYRHAKEQLLDETGLLGRITQVYGQWNRSKWACEPQGAPKRYPISDAILARYGYASAFEFRNWRWFRKYGGGPICDLGSHQIDVFGWFLGARPVSVYADGGADYWEPYEWHDNVYALYRFETRGGTVRALYETFSTTSARSYYESFMGDQGTLSISENPGQCRVYAEGYLTPAKAQDHPWQKWVDKGYLVPVPKDESKEDVDAPQTMADQMLALYRSPPPVAFLLGVEPEESFHQAHLRNFFDAVRGRGDLACPAEVGYETAVQVLKVHEALQAQAPVTLGEEDYRV
ncbi:MAG: Gfo/Idh/MocA family oxidoreductase [Phycisphaerae bacterium]